MNKKLIGADSRTTIKFAILTDRETNKVVAAD